LSGCNFKIIPKKDFKNTHFVKATAYDANGEKLEEYPEYIGTIVKSFQSMKWAKKKSNSFLLWTEDVYNYNDYIGYAPAFKFNEGFNKVHSHRWNFDYDVNTTHYLDIEKGKFSFLTKNKVSKVDYYLYSLTPGICSGYYVKIDYKLIWGPKPKNVKNGMWVKIDIINSFLSRHGASVADYIPKCLPLDMHEVKAKNEKADIYIKLEKGMEYKP